MILLAACVLHDLFQLASDRFNGVWSNGSSESLLDTAVGMAFSRWPALFAGRPRGARGMSEGGSSNKARGDNLPGSFEISEHEG